MDKWLTRIAYRRATDGGRIVAVFYDQRDGDTFRSYTEADGFGRVSLDYVKRRTVPAEACEFFALSKLLKCHGINPYAMTRPRF